VRRLAALAAASAVVAAAASPASATPAQDLDKAREAFQQRNYEAAIPLLNYLLYPQPRLSQPADLAEAHVLLGVCQFETGDRRAARREFEEALFLSNDLSLDPLLFSREAIDLFEDTRRDLAEKSRRDEELRRKAEELEQLRNALVFERHQYYVNFIPFGAGQFQNGQTRKGLAFAISQAVTAGVSLYAAGNLAFTYGFGGSVPEEEANSARRWQQVQVGSGILCLGLMAWGIFDSIANYEEYGKRRGIDLPATLRDDATEHQNGGDTGSPGDDRSPDDTDAPDHRRRQPSDEPDSRPHDTGPTSFRLLPTPLPGGGGLVLSWEY
jgi:tetratricopeptide (TPR) repeat protein